MRVIVCGAGIGGLVVAQALRPYCDVTVVERDADAVSTGGYRLALNGAATAVLQKHLEPDLLRQIRAVSDGTDQFAQFTVATDQLRPLVIDPQDPREDRLLTQRRALRLLLTRGLEERIRWSIRVTTVEQNDIEAIVHLSNGEHLTADLVIGAEGANSPTVRAVTALPLNTDLRLTGIAGSTPRATGSPIPRFLRDGPALVFSADGTGMFLSLTSTGSGSLSKELQDAVGPASLVWGLIAPSNRATNAAGLASGDLVDLAVALTRRWHPWMRTQIEGSSPDRVAAYAFRGASPHRDLTPWTPRRVTALGDAIHAMPPTGGRAAATAILDAGELAERVIDVVRGESTLPQALARYHRAVRTWAVPALRESLGPARAIRMLGNPVVRTLARPALGLSGLLSTAAR